VKELGKPQYK
jgi:hypothetical protein